MLILCSVARSWVQLTIVEVFLHSTVLLIVLICCLCECATFALGYAVEVILINPGRMLVLSHEGVCEYLIVYDAVLI